ncbi:uncharacterized protein LOC143364225 [Halictus rubicundus]|uniref:uncharacterized protein LOC143364225 n=1 Tax=Halictus rubicundus TaxID=77578 RepID=UPI0040353D87
MTDGIKVEFRLHKDEWETFTEQLEQLFIARDTKPEKKAAQLLVHVDTEAFKLIKHLVAPAKINTKSYDQIVEIMNEHINPKPSEVMERFNFNQAKQAETETVAEFAARLKKLALNCNFKEIEVALRDQFVCGLRDHETKVELFKKSSLTFNEAYKEATSHESAEKNATSSLNTGKPCGSKKEEIFAMSNANKKHWRKQYSENPQPPKNYQYGKGKMTCYCCGKPNHTANVCRFKEYTCHGCKKKGHLQVACRSKGFNGEQKQQRVQLIQRHGNAEAAGDTGNCSMPYAGRVVRKLHEEDFLCLKVSEVNNKAEQVSKQRCSSDCEGNPMYEYVIINGINIKMEIDTGPALIGREWLAAFGLWPLQIGDTGVSVINKLNIENLADVLSEKYSELFSETPGLYNKSESKIHLKETARPIALKCRSIAHALKPLVEKEFDRLVNLGHLKTVDVSEWATPIVPVFKSNVDEKSSKLLTIVTHKGLFMYTKIPEGVSPAPADVQRKMDECLRGIDGAILYLDNLYITGKTDEEHLNNLHKVCSRLQECGLRLNKEKCHFMKKKLEILGYVIDKDGLHKAKTKVNAMINAPQPKNSKELASFLGLVNFYARFLENRYTNGEEKPIAYASKKIAKDELNMKILDKEAMAIIFGFKRFYQFVFGKVIILKTDNKALQLILGPRKGIPQTADNRFQRWTYYLSGFRYEIEHIKSEANANCDALSRLPIEDETELIDTNFSQVNFFEEGIISYNYKTLAEESRKDELVSNAIRNRPSHTPLTTWPYPDKVWGRIHCDFAELFGTMYLIVVDAHSKWPEIINFNNNTKAYRLIEEFKKLFARSFLRALGLLESAKVDFISELPPEVSQLVLRNLDPKSLLCAAQVSRKWLNVCRADPHLRRTARHYEQRTMRRRNERFTGIVQIDLQVNQRQLYYGRATPWDYGQL